MRLVRLRTRGGRARLARRSRAVLVAASLGLLATGCYVPGGRYPLLSAPIMVLGSIGWPWLTFFTRAIAFSMKRS